MKGPLGNIMKQAQEMQEKLKIGAGVFGQC